MGHALCPGGPVRRRGVGHYPRSSERAGGAGPLLRVKRAGGGGAAIRACWRKVPGGERRRGVGGEARGPPGARSGGQRAGEGRVELAGAAVAFGLVRGRRSGLQVLLPPLLFDLVEGGARLIGRRPHGLLRPVVHQFVKVVGERASLVVAVVGLDLSEPCDWPGRRRGGGGGGG